MSDSSLLMTPVGRIIFPNVFQPRANKRNKDKLEYDVTILWPVGTDLSVLEKEVMRLVKEKFGGKTEGLQLPLQNMDKTAKAIADGVIQGRKMPPDYMKGMIKARFASKFKPEHIIDAKKNPIEQIEEGGIYSGIYGRVGFSGWTYQGDESQGVAFNLVGVVQKARDGEQIGGMHTELDDVPDDLSEADTGGSADTGAASFY